MANSRIESPLNVWLTDQAISDPEAYFEGNARIVDKFHLKNGKTLWGMYFGEAPRESIYSGTKGIVVTGHIHIEEDDKFESYFPTLGGEVLRVVTQKGSGEVAEGPEKLDAAQQMEVITKLEDLMNKKV